MENKPIIVEYLIVIERENTFCDSEKAFLNFLQSDSSITISENKLNIDLKKEKKFSVTFSLESDLVPSQKQRYFKFTLSSQQKNGFDELTQLLEKIITKLHPEVSINILWNDIARQYAIEGYTLINEVENLLRRLIANFMLTKVGYDYPKYHIPSKVEERSSHLKIAYSDYLHQTFLSDLKTILFEGQRDITHRDIGDIQRIVEKHISENKKEILVDDLKGIISKSLWEKYFEQDIEYDKKKLETDLEQLNSLRNEIAHNRHINRETLGRIKNLSSKIINSLKLAIDHLPNTVLSNDEQRFQIDVENIRISEMNPILYSYIAELALVEWYKVRYDSENVKINDEHNNYSFTDIIIKTNTNDLIGVQIKVLTSVNSLKFFKKRIINYLNTKKFSEKELVDFSEFHLALVFAHNEVVVLNHIEELYTALKDISPKISLVYGVLDDSQTFIPVTNGKIT